MTRVFVEWDAKNRAHLGVDREYTDRHFYLTRALMSTTTVASRLNHLSEEVRKWIVCESDAALAKINTTTAAAAAAATTAAGDMVESAV